MNDRSNYGPVRRLSPVSADNRKPYSRTGLKGVLGTLDLNSGDVAVHTTPDSPYYPFHVETPQLEAPTQNRPIAPDGPRDIVGFPTYEQYQRIEDEYLTSLSERKQPKALISQALFDKIFAVLQNGSEDRASTAQFRFWVRKMFVLVYPQTSFISRASNNNNSNSSNSNNNAGQSHQANHHQSTDPVVLHDKRPVAIREQLYEVLCYCHAVSRHGGRDKTCATLRLHYSWVPKELTAKFVKACPTCTLKRSGNPDLLSQFGQAVQQSQSQSQPPYAPPPTLPVETGHVLFPGGPNDSPPSLSFVIGPAGCDDATGGGGGGGSFAPSIFATPDLAVYPSPTLSTGSFGPMTPSPYLHNGLFGYPAVFDPGHGSLSSVAGWDPSPLSPCVPMYAEDPSMGIPGKEVRSVGAGAGEGEGEGEGAEDIIDMRALGMQLHLPTPRAVRAMRTAARTHDGGSGSSCDNAGRDGDGRGCGVDTFDTRPCHVDDTGDIDPALLTEGAYPSLNLVGPPAHTTVAVAALASADTDADADADADMDMDIDTSAGTVSCGHHFLRLAATWETRTPVLGVSMPVGTGSGATGTSSAGPSSPVSHAEVGKAVLLGAGSADVDRDVDIEDADGDTDVEGPPTTTGRLRVEHARWDSLEAWLVHSDSMDDTAAASDDMA